MRLTLAVRAEKQMDSLAEAVRRNRSAEVAAAERREALADLHSGRTLRSGPYVSRSVGPDRIAADPSLPLSAAAELPPAAVVGGGGGEYGGPSAPPAPQERCALPHLACRVQPITGTDYVRMLFCRKRSCHVSGSHRSHCDVVPCRPPCVDSALNMHATRIDDASMVGAWPSCVWWPHGTLAWSPFSSDRHVPRRQ